MSGCAGLLGGNFLQLLETAKRNVLQPGAAVVPCGATLYVMGIDVSTQKVAGYDLSGLNRYRYTALMAGVYRYRYIISVVSCGATMYVMDLSVSTYKVAGYDLSDIKRYSYIAVMSGFQRT